MDLTQKRYDVRAAVERESTMHVKSAFGDPIFDDLKDDSGNVIYEETCALDWETGEPILDDDGEQIFFPKPDTDKPVTITMISWDSEPVKKVRKRHDRMAAKGVELTPERRGADIAEAAVTRWSYVGDKAGAIDCTPENVRSQVERHDWLGGQIILHMGNLENYDFFMK